MYPFFWTTRERGILMRYDLEFKLKCINDLRNGKKLITPEGVNAASFERTVREWSAIELKCGMLALKPKHVNKNWTADEKFRLISKVLAGNSIRQISAEAGIDHSMLRRWVNTYKMNGYQGLSNLQKGRPAKEPFMKKINYNNPRKIDETEYEELIRLRAENEYIKTEIEVIKKEIALREEKEAAKRCGRQVKTISS